MKGKKKCWECGLIKSLQDFPEGSALCKQCSKTEEPEVLKKEETKDTADLFAPSNNFVSIDALERHLKKIKSELQLVEGGIKEYLQRLAYWTATLSEIKNFRDKLSGLNIESFLKSGENLRKLQHFLRKWLG